jgi:hypothetical protein
MSQDVIPFYFEPRWFLPLFVVMWFGMTGLFSYIGGWASLASKFASALPSRGERFRFASGSIGRRFRTVSYGNCLFVNVSPEGLGLSMFFPFRFMSPPLFIPWSDIDSVVEERILFVRIVRLEVRGQWARISLRGKPGKRAKEVYERASTDKAL